MVSHDGGESWSSTLVREIVVAGIREHRKQEGSGQEPRAEVAAGLAHELRESSGRLVTEIVGHETERERANVGGLGVRRQRAVGTDVLGAPRVECVPRQLVEPICDILMAEQTSDTARRVVQLWWRYAVPT